MKCYSPCSFFWLASKNKMKDFLKIKRTKELSYCKKTPKVRRCEAFMLNIIVIKYWLKVRKNSLKVDVLSHITMVCGSRARKWSSWITAEFKVLFSVFQMKMLWRRAWLSCTPACMSSPSASTCLRCECPQSSAWISWHKVPLGESCPFMLIIWSPVWSLWRGPTPPPGALN